MASYVFKNLVHVGQATGVVGNFNLLTAPALHTYLIKEGSVWYNKGAAGAQNFYFEISDAAGINFRRVTDQFTTAAPANNYFINLTPPDVTLQRVDALGVDPYANGAGLPSQLSSIKNKLLEPGQILRVVVGAAVVGTLHININGADYTA